MDEIAYGYDADSIVPEDFEEKPKKRGRKKKDSSSAPKKKEQVEEIDDLQLIESLMGDEEVEPSVLIEAFDKYGSNIDLTCDTTGMINRLRNQGNPVEEKSTTEHTAVGFVIKWCDRMMVKEEYSDSELEAFDAIKELLRHLGMI